MKIRTIVNAHLGRERLDALIAVLVPFVLMVESGYACGWVFADGDLSLTSPNTYWSLARGLFLEGLIYAVFKLVRMFVMHPKRGTRLLAIIPLAIGCMAMSVSAGMNLAWINRSGEMAHIVSMVSQFMPPLLVTLFKLGLGLLFPLSVGAFAIFDLSKLIEEVLHSAHLEQRAFLAENAELHRKEMKKAQKEAVKEVAPQYQQMAKADAQNMASRVGKGDYSFGLGDVQQVQPSMSVTRLGNPAPLSLLPSGPTAFNGQTTPLSSQTLPAQMLPPGPVSGNTQNIQVPPPPQPQRAQPGFWGSMFGGK
jgi:hypothetical protein